MASKIEELIQKLCPDGVKYVDLSAITEAVNIGINPRKFFKLNPEGAEGFYVTVRELNGLQGVRNTARTDQISLEAVRIIQSRANIQKGDILFSNTGTVGKMALVLEDPKNWGVNEGIYVIKPKQDLIISKFLYYYLGSTRAIKDYSAKFTGSTLKHVTQKALMLLRIPIPPLEIQKEIVKVLDNFTDYNTELQTELQTRIKQYEYYRDKLLSCNDLATRGCIKWYRLGEIGNIRMCRRILKSQTQDRGIPFFKIGTFGKKEDTYISEELFNEYRSKYSYPKKGDILISAAGTIGRTIVFDGNPAYFQDSNIVWLDNNEEKVINKYLYYFYQTNPWKISNGGTIARIYNENIENIKIPIPPKESQEHIVHILDAFDAVCNNIKSGLPAEISARQKQYEYYRDKLLTFKELQQ